jgi:hypothetical protein
VEEAVTRWRILAAVFTVALVACAAGELPPEAPAPLVPCARTIASVYTLPVPVEAGAGTSEVAAAVTADAPKTPPPPPHMKTPYKPRVVSASVDPNCGGRDNPCPLQLWMRRNMAPALAAKNGPALATALDRSAAMSPDPSWRWSALAKDAATAARAGDIETARKSCGGCHTAFKAQYKAKFRLQPVK